MKGVLMDYPELLAIMLLVLGWLMGKLLSALIERLAQIFNHRLEHQELFAVQLSPNTISGLRRIVFWVTLSAAALGALRILGMGAGVFANWLDGLLEYLPKLVVGLVIIGVGYVLATFTRGIVERIWVHEEESQLIGLFAHWSVLLVSALTGLEHIGLDVTFLANLLLIAFGLTLGSLALSFALGARSLVANLIARREMNRYQIGQQIRIGEHQGRIVEISLTVVVLETDGGLLTLPASMFSTEPVLTAVKD